MTNINDIIDDTLAEITRITNLVQTLESAAQWRDMTEYSPDIELIKLIRLGLVELGEKLDGV